MSYYKDVVIGNLKTHYRMWGRGCFVRVEYYSAVLDREFTIHLPKCKEHLVLDHITRSELNCAQQEIMRLCEIIGRIQQ